MEPQAMPVIDDQFALDQPVEDELGATINVAAMPDRKRHPALVRYCNLRSQMARLQHVIGVGVFDPSLVARSLVASACPAIVRVGIVERWRRWEVKPQHEPFPACAAWTVQDSPAPF